MFRTVCLILFLALPIANSAAASGNGSAQPGKPLITSVEVSDLSMLVTGTGLIKSPRDEFFFGAEQAENMISLPFTVQEDESLIVSLPYKPSTGSYRIGIGVNQKSLRVSELVTIYDDTGCFDGDDDGDGFINGEDDFPNDPLEWRDTDHDGIGDNADSDDDNDGVEDVHDVFPFDPAASVDTDGDGLPDDWNDSATLEQIENSVLTVDNDDDDDGVLDVDDDYPKDPTRSKKSEETACGNDFCVLNDRQFTDNDRTYFYNLGDTFTDFPFDQTEYQLSKSRESGSSDFEFEIEVDGQARLIELGDESFDAIKEDDYEVLASAFRNAGSQPIRLRRLGQGNRWLEFRLDGPDESVKVIFADLEIQDIDTLVQENTTVRVNRPTPGTGNRGGFNAPDKNCISFSYDPLTNLVESNLVASTGTNLREDMYVGGGQLLGEAVICDTTSTGTSEHQLAVIDGRGGSTELSLTLVVLDELVDGGRVEWASIADSDGDGVVDSDDAFPDDPAASVDTDGDGLPDDWNDSATSDQIAASNLLVDSDDDNDGIPDIDDPFPKQSEHHTVSLSSALAHIADTNLRQCISETYPNANSVSDVESLFCLDVQDLTGLRVFTELKSLHVGFNFSEITDLAYLAKLEYLHLDNIQGPSALDLEPLRGNSSLVEMSLEGVDPDANVISSIANLEKLTFLYHFIPVLPDFSGLTKLHTLNMYETNTEDISAARFLTSIKRLEFYSGEKADITPLSGLTNLAALVLVNSAVQDLSPLADLTALVELRLDANRITSLSDLSNLSQLRLLALGRNSDLDLASLPVELPLEELKVDDTALQDLSFLENFPGLTHLDISKNPVSDLLPLSDLSSLIELNANEMETSITSLGAFPFIPSLTHLGVYKNQIAVLTDTNNPQLEFIYLPGNPILCTEVEGYRREYPDTYLYIDPPDQCVDDTDSDGDGLSDAEEDRMGLDKLNPDSDADGVLDGQDDYSLIISGEFPNFTFDVITPFSTAVDGFLGIRSPTGCEVDAFFPEIDGNRARYTWTATENTPSGSYWLGGGATRQIGASGQISNADGQYELILDNQSGVDSSAEFVDWSVGPDGVMLSATGLINGAAPRYDFPNGIFPAGATQASDKPIVVSLQIGVDGAGNAGIEPRLVSETNGIALIQSDVLSPDVYEDARISRVWLCDGALNRTDVQGPDSDGDGAIDIFDDFPEDPSRFRL